MTACGPGRDPRPNGAVAAGTAPQHGRAADVARAALELFSRQGYDETTVDRDRRRGRGEPAHLLPLLRLASGTWCGGSSTPSWSGCALARGAPDDEPMMDVLRRAVMATNRFGAGELEELRIRIGLISSVPSLVAHSAVRYAEWCEVVAGFVGRPDRRPGPTTWAPRRWPGPASGRPWPLSTSWARRGHRRSDREVDRAFRLLATGFDEHRLAGLIPEAASREARRGARKPARCWGGGGRYHAVPPKGEERSHEDSRRRVFRAPRAVEARGGGSRPTRAPRGAGPDGLRRDVPLR